jgi:hypothetical protein
VKWFTVRNWLLAKLAGSSSVMINVAYSGPVFVKDQYTLVAGCAAFDGGMMYMVSAISKEECERAVSDAENGKSHVLSIGSAT